jgi:hypothetical protein
LAVASAVARFWGRWGSAELHRFLGLLVVIRQHFSAELQAFQERFSEGHLWLGPDRQRLAIGKSTYTLFGKSNSSLPDTFSRADRAFNHRVTT